MLKQKESAEAEGEHAGQIGAGSVPEAKSPDRRNAIRDAISA